MTVKEAPEWAQQIADYWGGEIERMGGIWRVVIAGQHDRYFVVTWDALSVFDGHPDDEDSELFSDDEINPESIHDRYELAARLLRNY